MQHLGKNHGGYHGETIDIRAVCAARNVSLSPPKRGEGQGEGI
jgi:hypothetical protein